MIRNAALALAGLVVLLAVVVAARTASLGGGDAPPYAPEAVDGARARAIGERLGAAIRIKTISFGDVRGYDADAYAAFHVFLEETYPAFHAAAERETVNDLTLLYRWPGADAGARPILFLAHQDVVPVATGTDGLWEVEPWSGAIQGGFVWGRGALDDKGSLVALMEAAETLAADGFRPSRDVYFAFGHDEEIGGRDGAAAVAALLKERGVSPEWSLDEGSALATGVLADAARPAAVISVAEKGYVSLQLTASGGSGHSSRPPADLAAERLAEALIALKENPYPMRLDGPGMEMIEAFAPHLPGVQRAAVANRWLAGGLLKSALSKDPTFAAMFRTTQAPTMLRAGTKDNVLPLTASAVVNFRVHPRDTVDGVIARTQAIVGEDIEIAIWRDEFADPSPVSASDGPGYRAVEAAVRAVYGEGVVAAPGMTIGGTDSKHFAGVADATYRFAPYVLGTDDVGRLHGENERVSLDNLYRMVRVYEEILRAEAGPR